MKSLKKLNFTLGPVMAWPEILKIGAQDVPYFRNQMFSDIMLENESIIKRILKTPDNYKVVVLTGSGTLGMDASITNFCEKNDHLLIVVGGKFGGRFAEIADCFDIQHTDIKLEFGKTLTQERLDEYQSKIDAGTKFTHLYVNLDETESGTLYDIKMLSEFAKKNNLFFVVDAISAFLADEINYQKIDIDVMITSSPKGLALPPGLAILVLSEKAINKKSDIPVFYGNIREELNNSWRGQTAYTPAVQTIFQLNAMLHIAEKENLVQRCAKISKQIRGRMTSLGFKEVSNNPSNAVTAFYMVEGYSARDLFLYLEEKNIWICPNGGDLADKVFRIGNIGYIVQEDIDVLINNIQQFLIEFK